MRQQFLFAAIPVTALVAPTAMAVTYLSVEQAQQAIFPGKACTSMPLQLNSDQRKQIEQQSRVRLLNKDPRVWRVSGGGWLVVDEVIGKHEYITYAVGLNSDGSVRGVEIMEYRESYGGEVRNPKWRAQFTGKTKSAPLQLDQDIQNISGATLSSRHISDGVRRVLALHDVALR
jgi:Na+-translocating ferredoxin:NAD+ oxidoreductase RnfG subunit